MNTDGITLEELAESFAHEELRAHRVVSLAELARAIRLRMPGGAADNALRLARAATAALWAKGHAFTSNTGDWVFIRTPGRIVR